MIEALSEWKATQRQTSPTDPVLVTRTGSGQAVTNLDHRIKTAIKAANRKLADLGIEPISERVSPKSLRKTYASVRAASGDDVVYIAEQIGHTDPAFTIKVYARAVKRRRRLEGNYLDAFEQALAWAAFGQRMGSEAIPSPIEVSQPTQPRRRKPHQEAIIDDQGR